MAEVGKGVNAGKLASNVQKRITRAQEKVLQKLGKADETKDTAFEEEVAKFNKQLADGTKLQKDLKAYMAAVKTMHECSKRLQDCLAEMYDPEWFGKEEVDSIAEDTDLLWQDFHQNLVDNALISMDTYLAQFPDIRARIAKRERKLVDFDSARHHFASIQKSKKKDEAKIAKPLALVERAAPGWAQGIITAHQIAQTNLSRSQAEEELGRAQKVFEEINYDLQEELPTLWDSRVGIYVNTFQSVAGLEEKFHRDMGKLNQNLSDIMTKLDEQRLRFWFGVLTLSVLCIFLLLVCICMCVLVWQSREGPPVSRPPRPASSQEVKQDNIINLMDSNSHLFIFSFIYYSLFLANYLCLLPYCLAFSPTIYFTSQNPTNNPGDPSSPSQPDQTPAADPSQQWDLDEEAAAQTYGQQPYEASQWEDEVAPAVQPYEAPQWGEQNSVSAQSGWRSETVKVLHDYGATDSDELDLKAGDIVYVLPFANPDEQDEGWVMGVKESHWLQNKNLLAKGVFPENFTQKL
uniref:Myc box-dependent-interacting protein 1 n=1 Tax=Cyprinus carpio TaxID=7962 RepID=A0A8C1PAF5_CYPCA